MTELEERRYKIKQILWDNYHTRQLEREMIEGMVSPSNWGLYLGKDIEDNQPHYFRALCKLFTSLLLNRFMEKCIDLVIEANEELVRKSDV